VNRINCDFFTSFPGAGLQKKKGVGKGRGARPIDPAQNSPSSDPA
jgi:hypothetical protein